MIRVQETTHHGDYYHQRVVELSDKFTWQEVLRMMKGCPYRYDPPVIKNNPRLKTIGELTEELRNAGRMGWGWTWWDVLPEGQPSDEELQEQHIDYVKDMEDES